MNRSTSLHHGIIMTATKDKWHPWQFSHHKIPFSYQSEEYPAELWLLGTIRARDHTPGAAFSDPSSNKHINPPLESLHVGSSGLFQRAVDLISEAE
jgi:hypothetical protein